MTTTFTASLRLAKPGLGDSGWGPVVTGGATDLTDSAIAGYTTVSMPSNADYTLTVSNGAADEARSMMLNITSAVSLTTTRNVICPSVSKLYIVKNATTGSQSITVKTSAGSGVTIPTGKTMIVMCNGTDVVVAFDAFNGTVGATTPSTGAFTTLSYTGTLTGGTGIVNLGSGQFYKDATGNIGIGTASPAYKLDVAGVIRSSTGGFRFPDGTVQTTAATGGGVTAFSAGTTGFTPASYTTGGVTLGGTLNVSNGGTGATTASGAATALGTIGAGQTIVDRTSVRALGTTYTNSTGRVIAVFGWCTNTSAGAVQWLVNSTVIGKFTAASAAPPMPFSFLVPNGSTYSVASVSGSFTLTAWFELA